jgi:DNA-binding LacI/PurR family transcriptional regulator
MQSQNKKITMSEIAAELGLNRMTVSSVLNNKTGKRRISDKTAQRVREYIENRGYVPHRYALGLRKCEQETIGILYSGCLYSHLTDAYNRMFSMFSNMPNRLEVVVSGRENIISGLKELIARRVSHLIWIHTSGDGSEFREPSVKMLLSQTTPIIYNYPFTSGEKKEEEYFLVGVNRETSYRNLAAFLKNLGHRVIIAPDCKLENRAKAFKSEGLELIHLDELPSRNMNWEERGRASAYASMRYIQKNKATALCYGDDYAAGFALSELFELGISVPEDVTVTGFDGLDIASAFYPRLTSLKMPVAEMVDCVKQIISGKNRKRENVFQMELIERRSHGKANKRT